MNIDRIKTYQELHEKYIHELEEGESEFLLPNDKVLLDFETWVESQSGGNKAYVSFLAESFNYKHFPGDVSDGLVSWGCGTRRLAQAG